VAIEIHRGDRTDLLAYALADVLSERTADPFVPELIVVPAKGIERWLSQQLSQVLGKGTTGNDGVCAGIEFANPQALIARLLGVRQEDPYAPEVLVWPLLATIDAALEQPWAQPLAEHLGVHLTGEQADLRRGRRYPLGYRLAQLFAQYATQRPSVLVDWQAGGATDGLGRPLPKDLAWQPPLWRALTDHLAAPGPDERHRQTCLLLRNNPELFELPERLSLFGHTRIAPSELQLLAAVAEHRTVHLWLPHPSAPLWEQLSEQTAPVSRREDNSHIYVQHPLLASLGRDTRELQRTLHANLPEARVVHHNLELSGSDVAGLDFPGLDFPGLDFPGLDFKAPNTLLAHLQAEIRANQAPTPYRWTADDRSVQIHACHGISRQVEVAREVVMGLLADDPTLEPRDIVMMCPDIQRFAPIVSAAFGGTANNQASTHPAQQLAIRLADQGTGETNPLLGVALRLLDLAGSRSQASVVLDFAAMPPVRQRFGLSEEDLERLTTWVGQSGVRWGFDAENRTQFGLENFVHNTWRFGLDRLLAGVAMSEDSRAWVGQTLPVDDVGSAEVELVGRFCEYVGRLAEVAGKLVGAHPVEHWLSLLETGVAKLTRTSPTEAWQLGQLQREFAEICAHAEATQLRLPEVRALVQGRSSGRPTRTNFRTGSLTVCTMVPMRSVPHRVVVLLGLDDGVFPRSASLDGDNVLLRDPLTGERDPRSEDRQLFLDAMMATQQHLVITYNGANEFTGQVCPPAVPLGEFLDVLQQMLTTPGSGANQLVTRHPLQPFDPQNHTPGALGGGIFSFNPTTLAGAAAAARQEVAAPSARASGQTLAAAAMLPPAVESDLTVTDLLDFARSPVRYFLKARLDVALPYEVSEVDDQLPVEVDALTQWGVGDRVLRDLLDGVMPADAAHLEWRRGVMPPGRLGWRQLQQVCRRAEPIAEFGRQLRAGDRNQPRRARTLDVDVALSDNRRLRGTVPGVYGDLLVPVHYSRLAATHRLQSWIKVLALTAANPGRNWRAHTVGRATNTRSSNLYAESILGPIDYTAIDHLRDLVALRDRALSQPLPIPVKASFWYARSRHTHADPEQAYDRARREWEGNDRFGGERDGEEFRMLLGDRAPLPGWDQAPEAGEELAGENSRFGALAMRLWKPLLAAEAGGW
jgi:exodeoxyribonuclease V gamma subunit